MSCADEIEGSPASFERQQGALHYTFATEASADSAAAELLITVPAVAAPSRSLQDVTACISSIAQA